MLSFLWLKMTLNCILLLSCGKHPISYCAHSLCSGCQWKTSPARQIFQFQFWPHRRYCHVILCQLLRRYDVISIFQDGGRGRSILGLLPVSYLLMPWLQKIKRYQQTKFRQHQWSTYINLWLRYNDFWFGKTNVHHTWILPPVPILTIFP